MSRIAGLRLYACLLLGTVPATIGMEASAATPGPLTPDAIAAEVVTLVRRHYVTPERIESTAARLEHEIQRGRYRELTSEVELAAALTADLQAASGDKHNFVRVSPGAAAAIDGKQQDWRTAEQQQERDSNFGIPELRTFPGGIGYLRIESFMEPQRASATFVAAMQWLAPSQALIIDLRGNGGGYGGLPEVLASYFFDPGPTLLATEESRESGGRILTTTTTSPFVAGARRSSLLLYVLIDRKTGSAAEWLAYVLQSFGKARIVGEVSAGAAHTNSYFPLTPTMRLSLATGRPLSAANGRNWEGAGVQPNLPCAASAALDMALLAARESLGYQP